MAIRQVREPRKRTDWPTTVREVNEPLSGRMASIFLVSICFWPRHALWPTRK